MDWQFSLQDHDSNEVAEEWNVNFDVQNVNILQN